VLVERDERVPERRDRNEVALPDLPEHRAARTDEPVGVEIVVGGVSVTRLGHALVVVRNRADRGRADVERDQPHARETRPGGATPIR
jgi:hypothetical protein